MRGGTLPVLGVNTSTIHSTIVVMAHERRNPYATDILISWRCISPRNSITTVSTGEAQRRHRCFALSIRCGASRGRLHLFSLAAAASSQPRRSPFSFSAYTMPPSSSSTAAPYASAICVDVFPPWNHSVLWPASSRFSSSQPRSSRI